MLVNMRPGTLRLYIHSLSDFFTYCRCVRQDYGFLGCYVDVLPQIDRECSGKRTCRVEVPNPELKAARERVASLDRACGTELDNYLSVSYKCVKGKTLSSQSFHN